MNGSHDSDSPKPRIILGPPESPEPSDTDPKSRSRPKEVDKYLEENYEDTRYGQSDYLAKRAHLASNSRDLSPSVENGQGNTPNRQPRDSSEYNDPNSTSRYHGPYPEHNGTARQGEEAQSLEPAQNHGPSSAYSEPNVDDRGDARRLQQDLPRKYPDYVSSLRENLSYSDYNRGDSHSQRDRLREDYPIENSDSFHFGVGLSNPKRSATLPPKLQSKAINHIWYEEHDRMHGNPKRQTTFDTKNSETFEETAPWDQKAILSLDGGGIRGYSALLILKELMEAIKNIELEYPREPAEADGPAQSSYHPLPSEPQNIMGTRVPERQSQVGNQSRQSS
ncbi:hypothetical protein MMC28_000461 [Mycoblastus sanguinarius]|nr:hypothetical protein [Mycoblastus sanguinarius]